MKRYACILPALLAFSLRATAFAQEGFNIPPRVEDHFQRNTVITRIALDEKINAPLIEATSMSVYDKGKFDNTNGLVAALLGGLESGQFLAVDPNDLSKTLTYDDVLNISKSLEGEPSDPWDEPECAECDLDDTDVLDEDKLDEDVYGTANPDDVNGIRTAPFESVIEIIEDRIFDKNRSAEIHKIQYIRLVWVDPSETLPDKNFICLKYDDVLTALENTQWHNKYNDAEDRNLREIFELRLFNGITTNVSGRGVRTLVEAEFRRNQALEFEHNLWSY
jgi:hypothetical protein